MAVFNEPTKWQTSLVNSGDANVIPQSTPAGTGEASFDDGFPPITQVPIGAGGQAPDRKDFNGLFKILGDWIFFAQNGGLPTYSADFDYVAGRVVLYNGNLYKCIQVNGASSTVVAPDSVSPLGSDYWVQVVTLADLALKADTDFSNIDNAAKIAIAHNAMPSAVYDELTLGASGTDYTAPADGYVVLAKGATARGQWAVIASENLRIDTSSPTSDMYGLRIFLPVRKGENFNVTYTATGTTTFFRFVYAVGSESEKA